MHAFKLAEMRLIAPDKSVAFCLLSSERDLVPANVHQPSYNIIDHITGVETQVFGL